MPTIGCPAAVRAGYEHFFNTLKLNVGFAVTLAGVAVTTGDIVAADQDGVVEVPFDRIDAVVARLAAVREAEARLDAHVRACGPEGLAGLEYLSSVDTGTAAVLPDFAPDSAVPLTGRPATTYATGS